VFQTIGIWMTTDGGLSGPSFVSSRSKVLRSRVLNQSVRHPHCAYAEGVER
jgi:hypothetical protein